MHKLKKIFIFYNVLYKKDIFLVSISLISLQKSTIFSIILSNFPQLYNFQKIKKKKIQNSRETHPNITPPTHDSLKNSLSHRIF